MPQLNSKRSTVQSRFSHAARSYNQHASLQKNAANALVERLSWIKINPERILDLGSGTGFVSQQLRRRYPKAKITACDIAHAMLKTQRGWFDRRSFVCGDAERLPFQAQSFDLIISNCTFQWCNTDNAFFSNVLSTLKPGGLLLFSTFGPHTLMELRAAFAEVDEHQHVNAFTDMHDLGDEMLRARFEDPVMDSEMVVEDYVDVRALMNHLKKIGASHITSQRRKGLMTRTQLAKLEYHYREKFGDLNKVQATFEIVYGMGWRSQNVNFTLNPEGDVCIPVSAIK